MTEPRAVVLERDLPFPPDRVWRALTTPHLISEWLMPNNFAPEVGHAFSFANDWGAINCQVLVVDPVRQLTYSWAAASLDSTVTFTLQPTPAGTRLRMEQAGFGGSQVREYHGARAGWGAFLDRLEPLLARIG